MLLPPPSFTILLHDPSGIRGPARVVLNNGRFHAIERLPGGTPTGAGTSSGSAVPAGSAVTPGSAVPAGSAVDLYLTPGFVDAHTHMLGLGLSALKPDLEATRSRDEAYEALRSWLRAHPGDRPVVAEGWDQSTWSDQSLPTREDLDRIERRRPIALRRVCGHIAVLNSGALEALGTDWPDLDPGTGLAKEALPLSLSQIWPASPEERDHAVSTAQQLALEQGVVEVHEMGNANTFRAFSKASMEGRLSLRIAHYFAASQLDSLAGTGAAAGFGDDVLRLAGLKIFLDGSFGGRSAAVSVRYEDAPADAGGEEGRGQLLWQDAALEDLLRRAALAGWPVAMHAIGDRAIDQAVSTVERLRRQGVAAAPPGPRLEHAEMLTPLLLERALAAGFFLSMQPNFTARWQGAGQLYELALGVDRAAALNPFASADRSDRLLLGSDTMPLGPLGGLPGATAHPLKQERLSWDRALRAYSQTAWQALARPFSRGMLAAGERATFVLLAGARPLAPEEVSVAATCVDGVFRYVAPGYQREVEALCGGAEHPARGLAPDGVRA